MTRVSCRFALIPTFILCSPAPLAADSIVLRWNQVTLQAIRNTRAAPTIAARALAVVHTCAYDAWAAYDSVAVGTRLGDGLRRPPVEHTQANTEQAISFAFNRCLVDLFPTQAALFHSLMIGLGYDPSDGSMNTNSPSGIGNVTATAVLTIRHIDGSNQLGDLSPGAYSDYTGYTPVNGPDTVLDPNRWQPVRIFNGTEFIVPKFVTPHWGKVVPFAYAASSNTRPMPPPSYPHGLYHAQANQLLHFSATLTDRQKMISEFWSDGPGSETPPGHWNLLAQVVARRDGHSLDQDVRMFFALNNALMDASIAVWECKRSYDYVRPITAIRFLNKGKPVRAWGGPYQGTKLIDGGDWIPYQPATFITPPFAEYVSGHSTFSASSATIFQLFTGSDSFHASVTLPAGSSRIEAGSTPAAPVTLSWLTFSEAAEEAGLSRRYGGIHFEDGDLHGRVLGKAIGVRVWDKALTYFNGTTSP